MNIELDEYIIYNDVKEYKYENCVANLIINNYNTNDNNDMYKNEKTIYWVLDAPGSYALGHFIFESFIFIKLLKILNNEYDNIKILTTNDKKYVKSILHFFNIKNEIVYDITNYNNKCFFPKVYSLNTKDINIKDDEYYNRYLNEYIDYITTNIKHIRKNKLVFLPRNDKDNYLPNDRKINNTDVIKDIVINNSGVVLDTYNINNIEYQFTIVNDSDTIILDYGSSFLFNCIFLKNKKIYILDDANNATYIDHYNFIAYLYNIINTNNELHLIKTTNIELLNKISK